MPVDVGEGIRTAADLSIWEQFSLAAFLQRHWADNQVSCTVTFDPEKEGQENTKCVELFSISLKRYQLITKTRLRSVSTDALRIDK